MPYIHHFLKYLMVTLLVWLACHLSDLHLGIGSAAILGFVAGFLEFRFKVWQVRQLTAVHEATQNSFVFIRNQIEALNRKG